MGTCCSTPKHALGEGATSHDHDSTIDNPIRAQAAAAAASNEEPKAAAVQAGYYRQHWGQGWRAGEQKMEEVLAQFDRSFDLGLARHAMDPAVQKLLEKDPLMLGFTPKEFRRVYDSIPPDGPLCTPDSLIGEMAPTSRAGADALVAKMDASGDFKNQNPFFWPPAYRILKDKVRRRAEARACARARARVRGRAWARAWARERACVREQAHEAYESPTTQHAPDP